MKKLLLLLFVCLLLIGCGETEDDYYNEENPDEYLISEFRRIYDKELVIFNKTEKENSTNLYDVYLKEDKNLIFKACTYWSISDAIPSRHYNWYSNYDYVYGNKVLAQELSYSPYGTFTYEIIDDVIDDECILEDYKNIFKLNSLSDIEFFAQDLYEIGQKEYRTSIVLHVGYGNKSVPVTILETYDINHYIERLNELK